MSRRGHRIGLPVLAIVTFSLAAAACSVQTDPAPEAHAFTGVNAIAVDAGTASRGGALFFQNCASCHGADGHGGFGPSLADSAAARDLEQVVQRVTTGGGRMPGFATVLSAAQIEDVSRYVVGALARGPSLEAEDAPLPAPATSADQLSAPKAIDPASGRIVYGEECASCHGPRGDGTALAGPLRERPVPYAALLELITDGNLQHGMPPYARILGANQIAQVAAYVNEILLKDLKNVSLDGGGGS